MVMYIGGTTVAKGWYWSPMDGGRVDMRDNGTLPGDKTCSYLKMSPLILLVIAPLFGMAFTFFLPLFGVGVLFVLCLLPVLGVFSADVVFIKAREIKDSVVIAWYHDQGLIPFKLLYMNSGVNLTLGLPFVRTSPDHGTAVEIAGQGIANPDSMIAAIQLAESLVSRI